MVLKAVCLMYLLLISVRDIKTFSIPDTMNAGFIATTVFANLESLPLQNYICGILFYFILIFVSQITKGLGGGDIKLMGVLGTILGFYSAVFTLLLASVFGIIFLLIRGQSSKIPFAPFITAGFAVQEILKVF